MHKKNRPVIRTASLYENALQGDISHGLLRFKMQGTRGDNDFPKSPSMAELLVKSTAFIEDILMRRIHSVHLLSPNLFDSLLIWPA